MSLPDFPKSPKKSLFIFFQLHEKYNPCPKFCQEFSGRFDNKNMLVDFCLTIKNAQILNNDVEHFELTWREDLTPVQLAGRFNQWLYDEDFLMNSLPELDQVGYCMLSINPLQTTD
jgi:hypothetical protein